MQTPKLWTIAALSHKPVQLLAAGRAPYRLGGASHEFHIPSSNRPALTNLVYAEQDA